MAMREVEDLRKKKATLRERARELAAKIMPIEEKKRRPTAGIGILNQFYPSTLGLIIPSAEHDCDPVIQGYSKMSDQERRCRALKLLREQESMIDIDNARVRDVCNHASVEDAAYFTPILDHAFHGNQNVADLYEKWRKLFTTFENEIAEVDREIAPLKAQGEGIDREIFEINSKLNQIAQAAQAAVTE
jgi:chromosome segregation ATPase